jgi:hypothetical protein
VETLLILLIGAGVSAAVVWWSLAPTGDRRRVPRRTRLRRPVRDSPTVTGPDSFVLLPADGPILPDDRPPRARSVLLLAATIAAVAALSVALVALVGLVLKAQLDRYFTGAG